MIYFFKVAFYCFFPFCLSNIKTFVERNLNDLLDLNLPAIKYDL